MPMLMTVSKRPPLRMDSANASMRVRSANTSASIAAPPICAPRG